MSKFSKGTRVAALNDIGGFSREFVPKGSEGVVVESPLWEQATVLFTVKNIWDDKKVRVRVDDREIF